MSDEIKDGDKKVEAEAEIPLNETRTAIMLKLAPVIEAAMKETGLNMDDPTILRRYFRAMVHLAIQKLMDDGAPPQFLVAQTIEAIQHEMEKRGLIQVKKTVVPPSELN